MEFECSFGILNWNGRSLYACAVKSSSSITKRRTRVKSCKGVHRVGKTNADVEKIEFNGLVVKYFPVGLHEIFPNLKEFAMYNCGLKGISRSDLIGLEGLTGLYLTSNQLKSLPDNLLIRMTKLTRVSFNNNKLEFVSSNLLQPIKNNKLIYVGFDGNPKKICYYEPNCWGSLGSLQELCDVIDKNFKKPMNTRQDLVAKDFPERIISGIKEFWTSGCFSDFVIICELKEFQVHKLVLAKQSSVLAAAFQHDMQESKTGRMEIKDFSKEAVEDFLKFMYTGETPEETNAMEILALASKYDVPELLFLMEEIILQNIDESNAIEILSLGNQHNCEILARAAFKEIQRIFPEAKLDPSLVANPEKLKQLMDAKRKYKQDLLDAKRESERILNNIEQEYEGILKSCSQIEK